MAFLATALELVRQECGTCGTEYAMSKTLDAERRNNGGSWYCPNGHSWQYTTPEVVRLRNELEKAQRAAIKAREAAAFNDLERAKAERKVARLLKRVKNGVCPAGCKRSFPNVRRHIESKHPELAAQIKNAEALSK